MKRTFYTCTFDGCDGVHAAKGLCETHYAQQRNGQALTRIHVIHPANVRFAAKVQRDSKTGCLNWMGRRDRKGYGSLRVMIDGTSKNTLAHRFAFFLSHGRWPVNHCCHRCDNPRCVEVTHLFDGTDKENQRDAALKDRKGKKLSIADIKQIRKSTKTNRELARAYGVSDTAMGNIRSRRPGYWEHV